MATTNAMDCILSALSDAHESNGGWSARCPAHEDRRASLSINQGDDGRVLLHCHAGCKPEAVVGKLGLTMKDLMPSTNGSGAKKNGKPRIVTTYNYNDADGTLLFQSCRYVPKNFKQRAPKPGGGWSWSVKDIKKVPYRLPELLAADPAKIVFIVEGEKDVDRLCGLGLVATTNAGGAGKWSKDFAQYFAGRSVVILPDNDKPGRDHARDVVVKLHGTAASIKIVELSGLPEKGDVSDWLDAGHSVDELQTLVDAAPMITAEDIAAWEAEKTVKFDGPVIIIGTDEKRVVDEAITAMSSHAALFQRGGSLVHIVNDSEPPRGIARSKDAPRISNMPLPRLREILAESTMWAKETDNGEEIKREYIHPPEWAIKEVAARGQWAGIRRLENIVESPVLRADGSVLQSAGYDPLTGLILSADSSFPPISDKPSKTDAIQARDLLLELVSDFPFKTDIHLAAWLAATLTPFSRYAIDGPAPLFFIDANVRGCGKSLLTDATGIVATGRPMPRMTVPREDEELRKRITAVAIAGEQIILLDNVSGNFGSQSLDAAITARTWSDRILGTSEMAVNIPLYLTWFATGNNVYIQADTARRVCHIRLESGEEHPEERSGFKYPDLIAYVRSEQSRLAAAAITILAAYWQAGRPDMKLTPWGSFEAWSDLVRQAVVWIDLPDPGETRLELRTQADREAIALNQLMTGWLEIDPAGRGLTAVQTVKILNDFPGDYEMLRSALWELCPPKDGKTLNPRSIGMKLHHLRQRVVGGRCFDRRDSNCGAVWMIIKPDTKASSDTILNYRTRAGARTHAHTRAHAGGGNTVTSPRSVTVQGSCTHDTVEETPTSDGKYINRQCRDCGEWLQCEKVKA